MNKKLRLQRWVSDDAQEEVHFFAGEEYILGYNPKKIAPDVIRVVLNVLGYETPE